MWVGAAMICTASAVVSPADSTPQGIWDIDEKGNLVQKAGVAINPHTNVCLLEDVLGELDLALVMSVNPGFGGQKFIPRSVDKVRKLRGMIDDSGSKCLIEIDGGINEGNVAMLAQAGVDAFVAGSSVFESPDPLKTISFMANA